MGSQRTNAHRGRVPGKATGSAWQARVHALFLKAMRETRACQVTLHRVARMLEVSPKTVAAWVQDAREVTVPAYRLLEIFGREDVIPEAPRRAFIDGLCAEFGGVFVPLPDVESRSADSEMRDVMEAVGLAAGRLSRAMADGKWSAAERAEMGRLAREIARQAAELQAAAEAMP